MNLSEIINPQNNIILMASAGTGKTFNLALRAVTILLQPAETEIRLSEPDGRAAGTLKAHSVRRLLCLTFTRKATAEMNSRIRKFLRGLNLYGSGELDEADRHEIAEVYKTVSEALGAISAEETARRAKAAEERIFRDPDILRVQTIDSFLSRILRQFPFETGVRSDYEIISNSFQTALARKAFSEGFKNHLYYEDYLLLFDRYIAAFDKNRYGFIYELESLVNLMCENITEYGRIIAERASVKELKVMSDGAEAVYGDLREAVRDILALIDINRPKSKDKKVHAAFAAIRDFAEGYAKIVDMTDRFKKLEPKTVNSLYPFKDVKAYRERWADLKQLLTSYINLKETLFIEFAKHLTGTVYDRLELQKARHSLLSYSDVLRKVYGLFHREDYPLNKEHLYFRLDGRVAHILADEFQDTSQLQWEVLAPLAEEAMAGLGSEDRSGSFFCVGDQKQSLYRFRGAVPGFMNKIGLRYAERLKKEELDKNRRSDREIVEFVNELFQNADKFIGGDETLSFSYTPQSAASVSDGFVSYTVCADWECEGLVLDAVYELLSHNFAPKDIAVLTLTWSNANRIHAYLEDNGIPAAVLEEEKLSEKAAYVIIKGLVSYMRYADDFSLSSFLYASPALGECSDIFFRRAKLIMNAQLAKSAGQTVYKRIIALKGRFNIISRFSNSMTELIVLMDIIARELSDIMSPLEFLERFEAKAADAAVSGKSPVNSYMNGKVGIGTVNQAKGLEYPAVILFKVNKEKTSLRDAYFTDRDAFSPFAAEIYMRRPKKSSEITFSPKYADALREENRFIRFDAVNKLYVAVTRARHALYLFAEKSKGETLDSYITDIFSGSFRRGAIPYMNTDNMGAPEEGRQREKNTLDRRINYFSKYILSKVKNPMELSNHPALAKFIHERKAEDTVERAEADMYAIKDYGLLFHSAVFYLREFTPDYVAAAAAKAWDFYGGYLKTPDRLRLENDLLLLLADERFYPLIKERRIYREKALYYDGKLLITDLYAKGETEINLLDFKTSPPGSPREKGYLEQIALYEKALAAYYNLPAHGFLFYINDGKVTVKETVWL